MRPTPHIATTRSFTSRTLLPLGALLLAPSLGAWAEDAPAADKTLKTIVITEKAPDSVGKDSVRATHTTIGKGIQELRDIPQSVTVVTEKLIDDRNLITLKEVLHNTAGVTFQAAEGGEEDIRIRGFSLATTGDIFLDGMRDPAFYERDTFNNDRIELLRGSASMLFGRGSTGGAVNQVSKKPREWDESTVGVTVGSYGYRRLTGDFNVETADDAALRITAMTTKADNNGAGSSIDKRGMAAGYRFGIGSPDEFSLGLYVLENRNGINYGIPWLRTTPTSDAATSGPIKSLDPRTYYGLASDYNDGTAKYFNASHTHFFDDASTIKTAFRKGNYTRDQRASAIRFVNATGENNLSDSTQLRRGTNDKVQDLDATYAQSDYTTKFNALGVQHEFMAGVDLAREAKTVYRVSPITKPGTTLGTPDDGAWVNEGARTLSVSSAFVANNLGVYAQDMVQVAPHWKVVGGLRYDRMQGNFDTIASNGSVSNSYNQNISDWSQRLGLLYQPDALHSYHVSYGTSFNTSADTYSYSALSANTPPEQSINLEIGAKIDSENKRLSTRWALFRSTKTNERNTDPDSAATALLLSGQRHTTGIELDVSGKLTPQWEMFVSYMWMPDAVIDQAAPTATVGERQGERPSLTPIHSGTAWLTYQFNANLRLGGGLNVRSEQAPPRNPGFMAPSFATLDLMAEYKLNERYVLKSNLTNVANTLYADSLYTGHYVPGAGRNLQVTLSAKF